MAPRISFGGVNPVPTWFYVFAGRTKLSTVIPSVAFVALVLGGMDRWTISSTTPRLAEGIYLVLLSNVRRASDTAGLRGDCEKDCGPAGAGRVAEAIAAESLSTKRVEDEAVSEESLRVVAVPGSRLELRDDPCPFGGRRAHRDVKLSWNVAKRGYGVYSPLGIQKWKFRIKHD